MIEIVKNVAAVIGCITACISLLTLFIKPFRQKIIDTVSEKAHKESIEKMLASISAKVDTVIADNKVQKTEIQEIKHELKRVKENVLENEADRIRAELFDCGNRCRRGIRLHPEEFEHIKDIYRKYTVVLHQNHEGETEYNFIHSYYNSQHFSPYHESNSEE